MRFYRTYLNSPVIVVMMVAIIHISAINWIIYRQQKYVLKERFERQLKAGISEDKISCFTFSKEQLSLLDWQDEREFILNGVFYDVLSKRTNADFTEVRCLRDDDEKALEELAEKMAGESDSDHEYSLILLKFIECPKLNFERIDVFVSRLKQYPNIRLGIDRFEPEDCLRPPISLII